MARKQKTIEDPEALLQNIAKILNRLKIPYIITGGFAVAVWGRPRFTADIVVEIFEKNITSLSKGLMSLGQESYLDETAIKRALIEKGEFNFIHLPTGLKVDFWIKKTNFDELKIRQGVVKKINNQPIKFISPENLILSKLLWYKKTKSDREIEDIKSILKFTKIDLNYLKKQAIKHNINENWLKLIDINFC